MPDSPLAPGTDRLSPAVRTLLISEIFPPQKGGSGRWFWEIYRRLPRADYVIAAGQQAGQEHFDAGHDLRVIRLPLRMSQWGLRSRAGLAGYFAEQLHLDFVRFSRNMLRCRGAFDEYVAEVRYLVKVGGFSGKSHVLDLAAGFGVTATCLRAWGVHRVSCLDVVEDKISTARKLAARLEADKLDFHLGDAAKIPLDDDPGRPQHIPPRSAGRDGARLGAVGNRLARGTRRTRPPRLVHPDAPRLHPAAL